MASKGPKPVAQKRSTKPLGTAPESPATVPPVPFVAQHAARAPLVKSGVKRSPAKSTSPAAPKSVETSTPTLAASPVPLTAATPVLPLPVEPAMAASAPVTIEAVTPDSTPADSVTPDFIPQTTSTPAIAPATAITQKDTNIMDATINSAAETAQTQAKTVFADVNDRAKTAMEKGSKMIAELNEFSKGNLEAVVESSKIAAKGAEDIARYTSDYVRNSVEKASTTASQFASIKSPTEFFKLHSEMTKQAMDSMMAETAKFTEGYVKLLGEIAQPISNRVAVAVEKVKVAA
jgi:phasin family protein